MSYYTLDSDGVLWCLQYLPYNEILQCGVKHSNHSVVYTIVLCE